MGTFEVHLLSKTSLILEGSVTPGQCPHSRGVAVRRGNLMDWAETSSLGYEDVSFEYGDYAR